MPGQFLRSPVIWGIVFVKPRRSWSKVSNYKIYFALPVFSNEILKLSYERQISFSPFGQQISFSHDKGYHGLLFEILPVTLI